MAYAICAILTHKVKVKWFLILLLSMQNNKTMYIIQNVLMSKIPYLVL